MDLIDRLSELSERAIAAASQLQTEEATKTALVMPFIQALGYDIFNPSEVIPEYTADVGIKRGEKVDYAVMSENGNLNMLFECKTLGTNLDKLTPSQLYRYFSVTDARIGVFTNGIEYQFFSDLEATNKMDAKPFFEWSLYGINDHVASEVKRFSKQLFDIDIILQSARELKYTKGIERSLRDEFASPSEEFVRLFCQRVYSGRMSQAVKDQFAEITKRACQQFLSERIRARLESAMQGDPALSTTPPKVDTPEADTTPSSSVVTTDEEIEAFYIVKSIVREVLSPSRVFIRDTQSYCGVLCDDNNRKPICRFYFDSKTKYIGLLSEDKTVTRHPIETLEDIFQHAATLCESASRYAAEN